MQPCQVCGGMAVDAAGYCTQCRAYVGPVPQQGYPLYSDQQGAPPYPGQPHSGQPHSGQAYPGQAYPGQAYPGQPYPGQASAPPYSGPPGPGYPPGSGAPGYPAAPAGPPRGRSPYLVPLIALCAALAVVVVGIVVVVVVKSGTGQSSGNGARSSAVIDSCLVGTWTVTKASQEFPISGVGSVHLVAQGTTETLIRADGTAEDNYGNDTRYEGSLSGHTYTLDVSGRVRYTIRTANGTITYVAPSAIGTVTLSVDGVKATSVPLSVSTDPAHYTCSGNTATQHTDTYDATLVRHNS
jgi:hypothetical protein